MATAMLRFFLTGKKHSSANPCTLVSCDPCTVSTITVSVPFISDITSWTFFGDEVPCHTYCWGCFSEGQNSCHAWASTAIFSFIFIAFPTFSTSTDAEGLFLGGSGKGIGPGQERTGWLIVAVAYLRFAQWNYCIYASTVVGVDLSRPIWA